MSNSISLDSVGDYFKKEYVRSASDGHLYLTILPTEKCNFRCTYCYEDFEIGKMTDDTLHGIKNLLTKAAPTLKNLMISWFGGEPTLNAKAMIEISEHIRQLQSQYGFVYKAHVTTNGYLLDEAMFTRFVELGINDYQITLDGDAECHDVTRKQASGKGSFEVIWNNLLNFRKIKDNFIVMLRLHITKLNEESMYRLCKMIKAEFGDDPRFTTVVEEIKNLGDGVDGADAKQFVASDAKSRAEEIKELMHESKDEQVKLIENGNPYICYASMPRQLLIRPNGTIGKCTVMLNKDANHLGKLNRNGDYELDGKKMDLWVRGFVSLDATELSCPARGIPSSPKYQNELNAVAVA
ncbi:radical SAM protein [Ferrimonas aestuarii]|uniref:Radical SAM protein n=1 Tax=Ferrimonas aestuarii TaxID=2569539 RepID=A0A4U1BQP3_9GAMM|nr:radical SAM protein [Ferrimonas aestuarii]TKB55331.1 radical SAM protein [Ferrimonas aestuarii]